MLIEVSVRVVPDKILDNNETCEGTGTMLEAARVANKVATERRQAILMMQFGKGQPLPPLDTIAENLVLADCGDGNQAVYLYASGQYPCIQHAMGKLIKDIQDGLTRKVTDNEH